MKNHETPWFLRIGLALTFFNSWVLFEETIVDRHGLWRHMPCYRVGLFCEWDVAAIVIIVAGLWFLFRKPREQGSCWLGLARCALCGRAT